MEFAGRFCKMVIENMSNAFAYHRIILDDCGNPIDYEYLEVNLAFEKYTGLTRDMVVGKTIRQIIPHINKDTVNWIEFFGQVAISGKAATKDQYSEAFDRWYSVNVYSPEKGYFVVIFNDITALKRNEAILLEKNMRLNQMYEELSASEEELRAKYEELQSKNDEIERAYDMYKLVSDATTDGIWYPDVQGDRRVFAGKWHEILGYRTDELQEIDMWNEIIHPDDLDKNYEAYLRHIDNKTEKYEYECRMKAKDGNYKWIRVTGKAMYDENGKIHMLAGAISDISKLKEQQAYIEYLAFHDSLTGLPNRALFMDRLSIAVGMAERNKRNVAVVLLDVDNFKEINDSMGHDIGDIFLKIIAKRLSQSVRNYETLARVGGDEFAVLLQNISEQDEAFEFCERLREAVNEPFELEMHTFNISISIGVAMYPTDGKNIVEILKNADTAMYKAKAIGKNNIQFFSLDMKQTMIRKHLIERKLKAALKDQKFTLNYQLQVDLSSGKIRAIEAFIRWFDKDLGIIEPSEFIPIAEETGLIVPIGEWIFENACRQGALWNANLYPDVLISINVSSIQLKQSNFCEMVKRVLKETGLEPSHLELEITEGVLVDSFEKVRSILEELSSIGVKISMDDFGTGYSSLNYLKNLPLNSLKIDKSFIKNMDGDTVEKDIAGSIVSLVHKLKLEVVAEGVETKSQLDYLKSCKCDNVQGYLFGRPVPAERVQDAMANVSCMLLDKWIN